MFIFRISRKKLLTTIIGSVVIILWVVKYSLLNKDVFYNPDEFEWLYILEKCKSNCLIGSFDSHTSGPLSIWILHFLFLLFNDINIENLHLIRLFIEILCVMIIWFSDFQTPLHRCYVISFFLLFVSLPCSDFWAYNTEYMLLPFLAYLTFHSYDGKFTNVILSVLCVFSMPFIKFQSLPICLFFLFSFSYQIIKKRSFPDLVLVFVFFALLLCIPFVFFTLVQRQELYFNYFQKNSWYAVNFSPNSLSSAIRLMGLSFIHPFKIITIIFFLFFARIIISNVRRTFFNSGKLLFSLLLTCVSLLCILVPRTNFLHYYILIVIPLTLLFSIFINTFILKSTEISILSFLFLMISLFNTLRFNSTTNLDFWRKTESIDSLHKINHSSNFIKYKNLDSIVLAIYKQKKCKIPILVSGWFEAQTLYYRYRKITKFVYRSNLTFHLSTLKGSYLEREVAQFDHDIKTNGLPYLIIVTESYKITHKSFLTLLTRYKKVNNNSQEFIIYQKIE